MAQVARSDAPTQLQNFLYLLGEMEAAVASGGIVWSEEQATRACQRLVLIAAQIGKMTSLPEESASPAPAIRSRSRS